MNNNFIQQLLTQKALPSPLVCFGKANIPAIAKTICAFLNEQGGWIIVGVDDDKDPTMIDAEIALDQIQYEVTNNIAPLPLVYIQKERYNEQDVILLTVIKGSLPPYSYQGKYYVTIGDTVVQPNANRISNLLRSSFSIKSTWESVVNLFAGPNLLDRKLIYEKIYDRNPEDITLAARFRRLIESAYIKTGRKVVILIDEYDKPLLDIEEFPEVLEKNQ